MWHIGGLVAASSEVPASGGSDSLLVVIGGIVVAGIGAAATVLVAAINSRNSKTTPSPPPPTATGVGVDQTFRDFVIGKLAVHDQRLDDADERDEVQDRRHDQVERVLDLDNPQWRHR